jgi:hypothetical protein
MASAAIRPFFLGSDVIRAKAAIHARLRQTLDLAWMGSFATMPLPRGASAGVRNCRLASAVAVPRLRASPLPIPYFQLPA